MDANGAPSGAATAPYGIGDCGIDECGIGDCPIDDCPIDDCPIDDCLIHEFPIDECPIGAGSITPFGALMARYAYAPYASRDESARPSNGAGASVPRAMRCGGEAGGEASDVRGARREPANKMSSYGSSGIGLRLRTRITGQ